MIQVSNVSLKFGKRVLFEDVKYIADIYAEPFQLNNEIPVRPMLYRLDDGSTALHLAIHHIAFDGGSAGTFINELMNAIQGKAPQTDTDLSDLYNRPVDTENGLQFYRELFKDGVPVNEMPIKNKRPKVHPLSNKEIICELDKDKFYSVDYIPSRGKNKDVLTTLYYNNCELLSWLKDTTTVTDGMLTKSQKMTTLWKHGEIPSEMRLTVHLCRLRILLRNLSNSVMKAVIRFLM